MKGFQMKPRGSFQRKRIEMAPMAGEWARWVLARDHLGLTTQAASPF